MNKINENILVECTHVNVRNYIEVPPFYKEIYDGSNGGGESSLLCACMLDTLLGPPSTPAKNFRTLLKHLLKIPHLKSV